MLLYKVFFCFSDWFIEISKKLIKNTNLSHKQVFPLFFVQSLLKLMIACLNPCFSITERLAFTRNKLQVSLNRTRGCVRRTSCPQLQQMLELTPGALIYHFELALFDGLGRDGFFKGALNSLFKCLPQNNIVFISSKYVP